MSRQNSTYFIAGELGKGGFGVVYLLIGDSGPKLALKTVDIRKIPEDYRERAKDEAKILSSLNHPHLVHHVNSYIVYPHICIITEFCAGGDLDKAIDPLGFRSGLPEKLIVCWLMQAASALNYMHTHDPVVLHRDLKPQNIYITESGDIRLGDLGLARKLNAPTDMATTQVGTILYLSPEILTQQPYNSKSDIWSLGCVFYDITGKKGGDDPTGVMFLLLQVMGGRKLPLPDRYTSALRETITSMLIKDHKQRPSAANILSSSVIQDFQRNPQRPLEIVRESALKEGRTPPQFVRDLSKLKPVHTAPLKPEQILVPTDALKRLADLDQKAVVTSVPAASVKMVARGTRNQVQAVGGISSNSLALFGDALRGAKAELGASDDDLGNSSDLDNDTFYDSQNMPELAEEHLLLQIQQRQRECIQCLGSEILEAAYGIIGYERDVSTLKAQLKELLGDSKYGKYCAKILELRALEYGLHKSTRRQSEKSSSPRKGCKVM